MFQVDEYATIHVTRGDVAHFQVTAMKSDTEKYVFKADDVVRLKVFQKKAHNNVILQKCFTVEEEREAVDIYLSEEETKIGEIINKPVDYWYEVELNPFTEPQTIVGYDDEGPKIFRLYPEGADLEDMPVDEVNAFVEAITNAVTGWLDAHRDEVKGEKGDKGNTGRLENVADAKAGQMLVVKATDENGYATDLEAVDRTHWKEVRGQGLVLEETQVSFTNETMAIRGIGTSNIFVGNKYNVSWRGQAYECTAFELFGSVCLGNSILMSGDNDTGEPFCFEMTSSTTALCTKSTSKAETIAVGISGVQEIIYHKLDKIYLPDDLEVKEENIIEALVKYLTENPIKNGEDGKDGEDGQDGITPHIGANGNWFIGTTDTGVKAQGNDGEDGQDGEDGKDATSPTISVTAINGGHRITITDANGTKSFDVMDGQGGEDGQDGITPHIGTNGNWFIGTTDTGVKAEGKDGQGGSNISLTKESIAEALGYVPGMQVNDERLSEFVNEHVEDDYAHIQANERSIWNAKSDFSGKYSDLTGKPTIPTTASQVGADASGTAESKVSAHNASESSHNDIRLLIEGLTSRLNALANSDDTSLDQMKEVVAYIKNNKSLIDGITTSKVNVADIIDNLTSSVSNKPLSAKQGVQLKALIDGIIADLSGYAEKDHEHSQYLTEVPSEYVKNTDIATSTKAGVVKVGGDSAGVKLNADNLLVVASAGVSEINAMASANRPITPLYLKQAVKTGLSKNDLDWTEEEKASAREVIGASSDEVEGFFDRRTYTDTILWDGDKTGLDVFDMSGDGIYTYYLVSETVPVLEDLALGATLEITAPTGDDVETLRLNDFGVVHDVMISESVSSVIFALNDNVSFYGKTIPKKGVYFMANSTHGHVSKLTITGYTGFNTKVQVLKQKHLPDYYDKEKKEAWKGMNNFVREYAILPKGNYSLGLKDGNNTVYTIEGANLIEGESYKVEYDGVCYHAKVKKQILGSKESIEISEDEIPIELFNVDNEIWVGQSDGFEEEYAPHTIALTRIDSASIKFALGDIPTGGGVTSWNDLTDRPFGLVETAIIPETTPEFVYNDNDGVYASQIQITEKVESGLSYKVMWGDALYEVTAIDISGDGILYGGNFSLFGLEDTGEPFLFIYQGIEGEGIIIFILLTDEFPTKLSLTGQEIKKLERKFIIDFETYNLSEMGVGLVKDDGVVVGTSSQEIDTLRKKLANSPCYLILNVEYFMHDLGSTNETKTTYQLKILADATSIINCDRAVITKEIGNIKVMIEFNGYNVSVKAKKVTDW